MLLKNLSLETFVKNFRSTILSKKIPKNSVGKINRTKITLRKLLLETFVKKAVIERCQESTEEKCN